jgi:hypothetical protein
MKIINRLRFFVFVGPVFLVVGNPGFEEFDYFFVVNLNRVFHLTEHYPRIHLPNFTMEGRLALVSEATYLRQNLRFFKRSPCQCRNKNCL